MEEKFMPQMPVSNVKGRKIADKTVKTPNRRFIKVCSCCSARSRKSTMCFSNLKAIRSVAPALIFEVKVYPRK